MPMQTMTPTRASTRSTAVLGGHGAVIATVDGEVVHVFYGIIDILQSWRLYKRAEHAIKSVRYPLHRKGVSVTYPHSYAERFRTALIARFESSVLDLSC